MTKQSLVNRMAERSYLDKVHLKECVDQLVDAMIEGLVAGEHITIQGLGAWIPMIQKPRKVATISRDANGKARLNTGKRMQPARRWIKFRMSNDIKVKLAQNPLPGMHATTTAP